MNRMWKELKYLDGKFIFSKREKKKIGKSLLELNCWRLFVFDDDDDESDIKREFSFLDLFSQ